MRFHTFLLVLFLSASLSSGPVLAAPIISEVFPQPDNGPEWVELYNPDETAHELAGWALFDQLASPSKIYEFTGQVIAPGEYLIAELPTMKLNNSADGVVLFDAGGGEVDAMQYETSTLGKSWSRISPNSNVFVQTDPTPGNQNAIPPSPTPSPTPSATPLPTPTPSPTATASATVDPNEISLTITQLYPCPNTGEQEWASLQNQGDQPLDLTNWRLRDAQNNFRSLSGTLIPDQEKQFSWPQAMLNNAGDELFVETGGGDTVASTSYTGCSKGEVIMTDNQNQVSTSTEGGTAISIDATEHSTLGSATSANSDPSPPPNTTNPTTYQLPQLTTGLDNNHNPQLTTGLAIFTHPPPENLSPEHFLSVILGGLSISGSGLLLLYEPKIMASLAQIS